jgi:transcriptional regulator with XRE-family HTH domain
MALTRFQRATRLLGAKLRARRLELGLTQEMVAEAARISNRHYQKLESGNSNPSLRSLMSVTEALGLNLADLLA